MLNKPDLASEKREAVVIKKYANRRLYNTETSTYVTLEDLAKMVRSDRDFVVFDAKTGDDLTHTVLTQIIVEQENREGGQTLLPIPFLRQLIRFYDDSIGQIVPSYLQMSLENLAKQQEKYRTQFATAFSNPTAAFEMYQEQARKNLAMFEQAIAMWGSFPGGPPTGATSALDASVSQDKAAETSGVDRTARDEIGELKAELAAMQEKIQLLSKQRE